MGSIYAWILIWVLGHVCIKPTLPCGILQCSMVSLSLWQLDNYSLFSLMAPLFVFGILKCGIPHNSSLHVLSSFLYTFFPYFDLFFLSVPSITCICLTSESIALHLRAFFFMVQHQKAQWFGNHTIFLFKKKRGKKAKEVIPSAHLESNLNLSSPNSRFNN